jgi:hypothetical protein
MGVVETDDKTPTNDFRHLVMSGKWFPNRTRVNVAYLVGLCFKAVDF